MSVEGYENKYDEKDFTKLTHGVIYTSIDDYTYTPDIMTPRVEYYESEEAANSAAKQLSLDSDKTSVVSFEIIKVYEDEVDDANYTHT